VRVGHGAEDPAQRADLQALEGPRRGHKISKETIHTSGVVVSSAQLDFGPVELRYFTCASSARAFDFRLVLFVYWGV